MASSRKRRPTADPLERSLLAAVKSAVDDALSESAPAPRAARGRARLDAPLVVAYSGGRDSSALLSLACALRDARAPGFGRPHAVHVHHGLHPDADSWVEHCQRQCTRSEEHTSELQSHLNLVCRLLHDKKNHQQI